MAVLLAAAGAGLPGAAWHAIVSRTGAANESAARERGEAPDASQTRAAAADGDSTLARASETATIDPDETREPKRRRRAARADGAVRVELAEPQAALGAALAVAGFDRAAPRPLDLWRIERDRSVRIARGESRADGTLAFAPILLPDAEVTLVATARGDAPEGPSASSLVRVRRDPSPPQVLAVEVEPAGTLRLRVRPVESEGRVVVRDAFGSARAAAAARAHAIDLLVAIAPGEVALDIAHVLLDGRSSPARRIEFATPNPEAADAQTVSLDR